MIQIAISARRHYHIMTLLHCFYTSFRSSPRHNCRPGSQTALKDFVPADNLTALRVNKVADTTDHVTLQLIYIGQSLLLHTLLTLFASLPMGLSGFVTADVDIFRREDLHNLGQNRFQEPEDLLISHTKITVLIRLSAAAQFRIRSQHLFAMGRHLYFWYDLDMSFFCIFNQIAHLLFSIIATVCSNISLIYIKALPCPPVFPSLLRPPRSKGRQPWISIYLHSPTGSVCQMQMHPVHLEHHHCIYLLLKEFNTAEMTRHIYMKTAIRKTRGICYFTAWQRLILSPTNHLIQCLTSIEFTCSRRCLYFDTLLGYNHLIRLW